MYLGIRTGVSESRRVQGSRTHPHNSHINTPFQPTTRPPYPNSAKIHVCILSSKDPFYTHFHPMSSMFATKTTPAAAPVQPLLMDTGINLISVMDAANKLRQLTSFAPRHYHIVHKGHQKSSASTFPSRLLVKAPSHTLHGIKTAARRAKLSRPTTPGIKRPVTPYKIRKETLKPAFQSGAAGAVKPHGKLHISHLNFS